MVTFGSLRARELLVNSCRSKCVPVASEFNFGGLQTAEPKEQTLSFGSKLVSYLQVPTVTFSMCFYKIPCIAEVSGQTPLSLNFF